MLGESVVVVYDASAATGVRADEHGVLSATGIRMHLLGSGQTFDLDCCCLPAE